MLGTDLMAGHLELDGGNVTSDKVATRISLDLACKFDYYGTRIFASWCATVLVPGIQFADIL